MTYNEVGKPGAEFFDVELPESFPEDGLRFVQDQPAGLDDGAYGARLTYLVNGWDLAAFYYNSRDALPAFARTISFDPQPLLTLTEVHERIDQAGATLAKDFGGFVLKAEAIYTSGRRSASTDPADTDGLLEQDLLDYVVGLEWALPTKGASTCSSSSAGSPTTTTHDDRRRPAERTQPAAVAAFRHALGARATVDHQRGSQRLAAARETDMAFGRQLEPGARRGRVRRRPGRDVRQLRHP
jgi:predicted porin